MKTPTPARLLLAGWLLALAACSNSPMSRIDANRGKYDSWPIEVRQAILNGEAVKGMTPEQVEMALGKPSEVVTRSAPGKGGDDEVWVYRKSSGLGGALRNTGISVGGGTGGMGGGISTSTGGRGETPEESEVVFRNGVVSRSDAKR